MEELFSNTGEPPLNKIIIPGSHDSGAYDAKNIAKKKLVLIFRYRILETGLRHKISV